MSDFLIVRIVRALFLMTSRDRAARQAIGALQGYMELADELREVDGSRPVRVPPMRGVDEDMRHWSFFMILEHNCIVNRTISAIVRQLAKGEPLSGASIIDLKSGVMPSPNAGSEQVARLRDSVRDHLEAVASLGRLRGTKTARHPVFGDFDAHQWNCMFGLHLKLHHPQAVFVVRTFQAERTRGEREGARSGS